MNHRAAIPLLKTAQAAWQSESRMETYIAILAGVAGLFVVGREVWRFWTIWADKN
jgi:hypothetical protein